MEEYLSYDRMIAMHRNQINPVPAPPHTMTFAVDHQRYDKMGDELGTNDNIVRRKTLTELNFDFHQSCNIMIAITVENLMQCLRDALKDPDNFIRELAISAYIQIAKFKNGREFMLERHIVLDIAELFDDKVEEIRRKAYDSLWHLSDERFGCEGVVEEGIIEILVDKLLSEKSERILVQTMTLIRQLLDITRGPIRALTTPMIARLKNFLDSRSTELKTLASQNLSAISFSYPGKEKVIEGGCVSPLADLLYDASHEVRTAALLALGSLSIEKAAKVELIEGQYLSRIIQLLNDPEMQIRLNTVQLISNVAEHPLAKLEFQNCLDRLREMQESDVPMVSRFSQKAIDVITWRP